jgi:hypothetical protein
LSVVDRATAGRRLLAAAGAAGGLMPFTDNAQARECARTIAGWKPLTLRPMKRMPKVPRLRRVR